MEFTKAATEINFILENLNPEDREKIPNTVIQFFRNNKDVFYKPELDVSKDLKNQNLLDETRAFLLILSYKYLANPEEKEQLKKYFDNNTEIKNEILEIKKSETDATSMIVYKENKFILWLRKIFSIFKK